MVRGRRNAVVAQNGWYIMKGKRIIAKENDMMLAIIVCRARGGDGITDEVSNSMAFIHRSAWEPQPWGNEKNREQENVEERCHC